MTLGVPAKPCVRLPGSRRPGEYARWKSRPARRPEPVSRSSRSRPSVVPGGTGDSRRTVVWGRSRAASARAASVTAVRSRARSGPRGSVRRGRRYGPGRVRRGRRSAGNRRRACGGSRARSAGRRPGTGRRRVRRRGGDRCRSRWCRRLRRWRPGRGESVVAEADDGEISGHGGGPSFPVAGGDATRKPWWTEWVERNVRLGVNMTDMRHCGAAGRRVLSTGRWRGGG